jgi:hypothetical protein
MLSFVTSQAIALSRGQPRSLPASDATANPPPRTNRKRLLFRVLDALAEARMRRAEIEIQHHRRFFQGHTKLALCANRQWL